MNNEEMKSLKIAVIGAGAIGGITAAFLKKMGYNVSIVCKYEKYAEKINTEGIHIFGVNGEFQIVIPSVAKIMDLDPNRKFDIIFTAVKATDLDDVAKQIDPYLLDDSVVVTLENGIVEEKMADWVGKSRVVGAVTGFGATMYPEKGMEMTSMGEFVIGTLDNIAQPKLQIIQQMLSTIVPTRISRNIIGDLYSKLIINSCITSLGAVCGLFLGEMLRKKKIRKIFIEIIREAIAVADASNIHVEVYNNKLNYYTFLKSDSKFNSFKRHLLIKLIGFKYRRLKSSSLQSLLRNKPTEIHFLNGFISDKGREFGILTPVNDKIIELIEEIEMGKRKINLSNFDEDFFDRFN
ncbi:MAG: ketopantoate reductase family protein [Promethearchaeota archaeon]